MGLAKIITFDMGGTSTDVSLCNGGPLLTKDYRLDGYPVRIQVIDIQTVGAGGGSLARVDAGGLLRVGPASAGADPGPVCYGKGEELTVTDANLYLGRLLPDRFLGGAMHLDHDRVAFYLGRLAARLDLTREETALGIIRVVNAGMVKAIRAVSLERGHNPREFALFAFGGAAGLHCCELAAELGIGKIVVPARAGILSAQGMVFAEPSFDFVQALFLSGSAIGPPLLDEAVAGLEHRALAEVGQLCREGIPEVRHFLDLRYQGQSFELTIPFREGFQEQFHQTHEQSFGYCLRDAPLELVSIRCTVRMRRARQRLPRCGETASSSPAPQREAIIRFSTSEKRVKVFERSGLRPGHRLAGPALIVDDYTTILLPSGFALGIDLLLNLVIENR
jgi:N-methylhydantoinase A